MTSPAMTIQLVYPDRLVVMIILHTAWVVEARVVLVGRLIAMDNVVFVHIAVHV